MKNSAARLAAAAICLVACASANGDTARWIATGRGDQTFLDLANWEDSSGNALADFPTNGQDIVFASTPEANYSQNVFITNTTAFTINARTFRIGTVADSLSDEDAIRRYVKISKNGGGAVSDTAWFTLRLAAPGLFAGFWNPDQPGICFELPGSALMQNVYPTVGRFRVKVPDSGAVARIGELNAPAVVDKLGAGTLKVDDAGSSGESIFVVSEGTLSLGGADSRDCDVPSGAFLHLDATEEDSFTTYKGDDGRVYVKRWNDKRHRNAFADNYWDIYSPGAGQTNAFISPVTANGNRLVDFGARTDAKTAMLGPKGGVLKLQCSNGELSKVREAFYAGYITESGEQPVLGSLNTVDLVHYSTLAAAYSAARVRYGDVIYNGRKRPPEYSPGYGNNYDSFTNMHVLSVGSLSGFEVALLASDRLRENQIGGCRIGEVILYTNSLTHAQRMQVHRYLMKKWMEPAKSSPVETDADALVVKRGATIDVPAGKAAHVGPVFLQGTNTLLKTGGGTLAVADISPAGANLEVRGGSVVFDSPRSAPDTSSPAPNPVVWFDASVRSSFVISNNTTEVALGAVSTNFITRWNDKRTTQTATYLQLPKKGSHYSASGDEPSYPPFIVPEGLNGMDTVSLGWAATARTWMILNAGVNAYEGFVVVRHVRDGDNIPTLNTIGQEFIRLYNSNGKFINPTYGSAAAIGGRWAKNGVVFDPSAEGAYTGSDSYHVLNFSFIKPFEIRYLCKDRTGNNTPFGCQDIAEIILYSRPLGLVERQRTEAYLMKRWLNKDHPLASKSSASIANMAISGDADFCDGTARTLSVSGNVSVSSGVTVALDVRQGDGLDCIAAGGKITFSGPIVLDLSAAAKSDFAPGRYPVFTAAGGIEGFSALACEVLLPDGIKLSCIIKADANTVSLEFLPPGHTVILR